jgi:DNA-binding NtrC family response regulator
LRQRKDDIHLIFRKFANDFADKYRMPALRLDDDAVALLVNYSWPGNIRQLKNLVEQISVIETAREINAPTFIHYLPAESEKLPSVLGESSGENFSEREIMYKFLFDMKKDLTDLKKLVIELIGQGGNITLNNDQSAMLNRLYQDVTPGFVQPRLAAPIAEPNSIAFHHDEDLTEDIESHVEVEESLSLEDREKELIQKALEKHRGKRKYAAAELGISERTLYRKIKEYHLPD